MSPKKLVQLVIVTALLFTSFASAGGVSAWSQCPTYLTVQWGDTLSGIAQLCHTTVDAIRSANPGLGWWLYAGQTLYIPTGSTPSYPQTGGTYVVQTGDTLGKIAARSKTSVNDLLKVNPQITNPSLIYAGQVINLPAGVNVPPPTKPTPPPTKPTPPPTDSYAYLKVTYEHGLHIRTAPGGTIISSALYKDIVTYKPSSVFVDKNWKVWVEVKLYPPMNGYYTGWMLVRDQMGTYYTSPQIAP